MTLQTPSPFHGESSSDQPMTLGPGNDATLRDDTSATPGWGVFHQGVPQPIQPQSPGYPQAYQPALGRSGPTVDQPYVLAPARARRGLARGLAWLVGVVVAVSAAVVLVVEHNDDHLLATTFGEGLWDLKVGRCTDDATFDEDGSIDTLDLVPCDQKHYFEAFASLRLTGDTFPGEDQVSKRAQAFCDGEFPVFMGISQESSQYVMLTIYPSQGSWDHLSDRTIFCLVGDHVGETIGSLKGVRK